MEETPTKYLQGDFNQDAHRCLGCFGLKSHTHTMQASKLSGG